MVARIQVSQCHLLGCEFFRFTDTARTARSQFCMLTKKLQPKMCTIWKCIFSVSLSKLLLAMGIAFYSGASVQVASSPSCSAASISSPAHGSSSQVSSCHIGNTAAKDSLAAGSSSSSYCKTTQRGLLSVCSPTDRCSSETEDVMTDPTSAHLDRASSARPDLAQGLATPCQLPCQAHSAIFVIAFAQVFSVRENFRLCCFWRRQRPWIYIVMIDPTYAHFDRASSY